MSSKTVEAWHALVKSKDPKELDKILSDEVVFYSPVVHTPQEGKDITTLYLTAALYVFVNETFHYVREVVSGNNAVLEFETEIDGVKINGVDMMSWNEKGEIISFKVMLRPLKAINLIHKMMGEMLEKVK
ncbi:MAG: nuclear transport factor 2 family protein [Desulfobacteraceae bacterium]|nr:nuclear transport factor 2 family protein [Desulfobacteraceae bacterium]MCB9494710.1 nuclear transport factor 2 family protein [Desulfobacteraceae bacterium]